MFSTLKTSTISDQSNISHLKNDQPMVIKRSLISNANVISSIPQSIPLHKNSFNMNYSKKPSKEAVEASNISFRTDRYRRYVSNISTQRENTETVLTSEINEWNTHRRTSDIPQFNSSIYPNFIFSNYNREFSKSLFGENKDSANAKIIDKNQNFLIAYQQNQSCLCLPS